MFANPNVSQARWTRRRTGSASWSTCTARCGDGTCSPGTVTAEATPGRSCWHLRRAAVAYEQRGRLWAAPTGLPPRHAPGPHREHWGDMLRVAGSLALGEGRGHDLIRMLSRDGKPTALGDAFAHYGRPLHRHRRQAAGRRRFPRHRRTPRPSLPAPVEPHQLPRPLRLHPARRAGAATAARPAHGRR
ncbi:Tn3 family transposase [Streptomyces shenzhenensis]|uniref:Tn3 family transposase n=1 Tax=Streptomyces shenzhenensis TaxID=943815 RepID=UPI0038266856